MMWSGASAGIYYFSFVALKLGKYNRFALFGNVFFFFSASATDGRCRECRFGTFSVDLSFLAGPAL